jgi:hypothetical protein
MGAEFPDDKPHLGKTRVIFPDKQGIRRRVAPDCVVG